MTIPTIIGAWLGGLIFAWALVHVGTRGECDECGGVTGHTKECSQ
jgi:hypothetical protein